MLNKGTSITFLWSWPSYARYGDIAKHALAVVKSKKLDASQASDSDPHSTSVSADRPEGFDGCVHI